MTKYEIMFIVNPNLETQEIKGIAEDMKKTLEDNQASIKEEKEMGQKELAYTINKHNTGYYFLYLIESENSNAINEFNRLALINENILRHLIIKVED
ncbi:MAG: 30S ribosomal protein S6 [Tenericutes bacterium]|jgi:small subunit ribosomal protein S6|nr:30S ribosomal protein S6 [Mycoplasmatota bacterium]